MLKVSKIKVKYLRDGREGKSSIQGDGFGLSGVEGRMVVKEVFNKDVVFVDMERREERSFREDGLWVDREERLI